MTEPSVDPIRNSPGFMDAFDWRKGRTWAAFIGSAFAIGCVLSVILLVVSVLVLNTPPHGSSEDGWFTRTLLMFVFVVPLVVYLRHMTWRTPQAASEGLAESDRRQSAWVELALDIFLHALWLVLAFSTCAALVRMAGPSYDLFKTDRTGMVAVWLILGLVLQDIPALLHRWAKPKAPPTPSPPDQANAGRERRP